MNVWLRTRKDGSTALGLRMDDWTNAHNLQCPKCKGVDWVEKMGGFVCSKCRYFVHRRNFK
jgi:transposase-like protein